MHNIIKQSEGEVRPKTYHGIDNRSQAQERDAEEHPALGGGGQNVTAFSGEEAPRLVIRGESFQDNSYQGEIWKLSQRVTIINLSWFTSH